MHSRIIELSEKPIEVDERIDESEYYDNGFLDTIGDYVDEDTDRTADIEWFAGYLKNKGVITEFDTEKIVFSTDAKEKFFRNKYETFKKLTSEITFEEFSEDSLCLYNIRECINDKFGFYVHYAGCYYTLDNFIRHIVKDGETWYIGGTLDYHC